MTDDTKEFGSSQDFPPFHPAESNGGGAMKEDGNPSFPPIGTGEPPYEGGGVASTNNMPAVSETDTKSIVLLGMFLLVGAVLLYNIVFGGDDEQDIAEQKAAAEAQAEEEEAEVVENSSAFQAEIDLPPPPPPELENSGFDIPAPPPPPGADIGGGGAPALPNAGSNGSLFSNDPESFEGSRMRQRVQSSMLIGGGTFGGGSAGNSLGALIGGADIAGVLDGPSSTSASSVKVTIAGNPEQTIYQGKVIDAVLESAINTDLPGSLRAVVSRDVYAEAGRAVLIPKGSRLIGSYNVDVQRGQARVFIIWDRVIRPDGIDAIISSPATDILGRAGLQGEVDNKYLEIFSNSLLLSAVTIGFAALSEEVTNGEDIVQGETGSGDVTQAGNVTDIATLQAVEDFSSTVQNVLQGSFDARPRITVDQGVRIKVFVNRDIKFPAHIATGVQEIR